MLSGQHMSLSVWEVFLALFRGGKETEEELEEGDGGRFVPSPLDLSVRLGHGGSERERIRALSGIHDQAQQIEEERRGN